MSKDGGPAFPFEGMTPVTRCDGSKTLQTVTSAGMSLRDYFAAKALPAIIARIPLQRTQDTGGDRFPELTEMSPARAKELRNAAVALAYEYADTMLAARQQTGGEGL